MYSRRQLLLGSTALTLTSLGVHGQEASTLKPSQAGKPPLKAEAAFSSSVSEVIVPVTVTDEKGRFVRDLELKDFELLDEGKPQQITYFTRERNQPVVIGFLDRKSVV